MSTARRRPRSRRSSNTGVGAGIIFPKHLVHQALVFQGLGLQKRREILLDECSGGGVHEPAEL